MKGIRIFIASPSDVAEERLLAHHLIERLSNDFVDSLDIQSMIWEHEPLVATSDFQSQIGSPRDSDIFVLIMWARFGSPLGADFQRDDGSLFESATQYEFEEAMAASKANTYPEILAYRKTVPIEIKDEAARSQSNAVAQFFQQWFINPEDNTAMGAFHEFSEAKRFEDILEIHLRKLLKAYIPNPNNLPASLSPFIGRRELTNKVCQQLMSDELRLLTLVGPGGSGKTRFAFHVAQKLLAQFKDGVFFIPLASVTDPKLVPSAIANILGIKESDKAIDEVIIQELKRKQLLLLIDNLEQVQSSGKYLNEILNNCPEVKVLVTSRETLRFSGAKTVRMPPLELPNINALPPLEELQELEAIGLFVARAQAVREDFVLNSENARYIVEICQRIDALPLAIELAASRIRMMSVERLAQVLDQRFKVLTGGGDDLLGHQKSLRALIAWSYELLDESEQKLWRRLAVFANGCGYEAAQEVCDPEGEYFIEVDIETLLDKSLVNIELESQTKPARITMLESLREFAQEQLLGSSEYAVIQGRFLQWNIDIGFIDENTSMDSGFANHLDRLDLEQNNLRAALGACSTQADAETAMLICGGLYQYWFTRGQYKEGSRWIETSLGLKQTDTSTVRGRALKGLSTLLRGQAKFDEAAHCAKEALDIFSQQNDKKMRASLLCELGAIAQGQGDFDKASDYLEACIKLARAEQISDHNMSFFLIVKGISEHLKGELEEAKKSYIEGLSIAQDSGDKTRTANALLNLGEIFEAEGQYQEAYSHYQDSLKLWGELQHKAAIARLAEVIAGLEIRYKSVPSEAAFLFGAAEAIREAINVPIEPFNMEAVKGDVQLTLAAIKHEDYLLAWKAGRSLEADGILRHVLGDT